MKATKVITVLLDQLDLQLTLEICLVVCKSCSVARLCMIHTKLLSRNKLKGSQLAITARSNLAQCVVGICRHCFHLLVKVGAGVRYCTAVMLAQRRHPVLL